MPAGPSQTFAASYDNTVKIISFAAVLVMLVPMVMTHMFWIAVFVIPVILLGYAFSPRGYEVSDRSIVVKRLIGDVRIPLETVAEARRAGPDDLCGCIRLWGSGGFFGYYGLFRTKKLGVSRWFLTNRHDVVVVTGSGKPVLFSPDNAEGFLGAIYAVAPVRTGPSGDYAATSLPLSSGRPAGVLAGVALAVIGGSVAVFATLYSPGLPSYTLTQDALTIRDTFYPVTVKADGIDTGAIRVVDITAEPDWRPVVRTNGFSNSHYHSGWFRTAGGQSVRMYWTDGRHLVLLPPKGNGTALLFEAADPYRSVEEIKQKWLDQTRPAQ